jgi:DUF971 family protein
MTDASQAAATLSKRAVLSPDGNVLCVALDDGRVVTFNAAALRAACRCAHCRRAQIDGVVPVSRGGVTITRFAPLGHYAINIAFSDGHERGIFPWAYFAELAARESGA